MELTQKIEDWTVSHHPAWLDVIRVALGIFLFGKGIVFLNDIWSLQNLLQNVNIDWNSLQLAYIIAFVHLIGGFLIAIGLFTRLAVLFQIPILIGAVFFIWPGFDAQNINQMVPGGVMFVWSGSDTSAITAEWWTSLVTLLLLVVFLIFDSGPWSVDHFIRSYEEE
jgi:putative oxidoreductase